MKRFLNAFKYAFKGMIAVFRGGRNIYIHTFVAVAVIVVAILLRLPLNELAIIALMCFLVIIMEFINTGIERLVDLISPSHNSVAGEVKDIFAGAVLLTAFSAVVVGAILMIPPAWKWLMSILTFK